ncbi:MAG: class I SAM-dependent methyltransferase [Pseudomonadota bacterium]
MDHQMTSEDKNIIEIYRRHADAWVKLRGQHLLEKKWLDKFLELLPNASSVLDIGCGFGEPIGRYLFENGSAVTGIDASPELIQVAKERVAKATWIVSDMRALRLADKFDGLLAWNSTFHLTPNDQRQMFPIFQEHAAKGAALMFTSGPSHGDAIGEFEGEPLYHSSLDGDEYRLLLDQHGFDVIEHVVKDPDCGQHTVWLARFREPRSRPPSQN